MGRLVTTLWNPESGSWREAEPDMKERTSGVSVGPKVPCRCQTFMSPYTGDWWSLYKRRRKNCTESAEFPGRTRRTRTGQEEVPGDSRVVYRDSGDVHTFSLRTQPARQGVRWTV